MFGKFYTILINFLYFSIVYLEFIVKYSVRQSASSHLKESFCLWKSFFSVYGQEKQEGDQNTPHPRLLTDPYYINSE